MGIVRTLTIILQLLLVNNSTHFLIKRLLRNLIHLKHVMHTIGKALTGR